MATPGGQQRTLEIGRTLLTSRQIIRVDDLTAGLAKRFSEEVYRVLTRLRNEEGMTIILVDQDMRQTAMSADLKKAFRA